MSRSEFKDCDAYAASAHAKKVDTDDDTSVLEAEIDDSVFDFYGLTEEERALVQGAGK